MSNPNPLQQILGNAWQAVAGSMQGNAETLEALGNDTNFVKRIREFVEKFGTEHVDQVIDVAAQAHARDGIGAANNAVNVAFANAHNPAFFSAVVDNAAETFVGNETVRQQSGAENGNRLSRLAHNIGDRISGAAHNLDGTTRQYAPLVFGAGAVVTGVGVVTYLRGKASVEIEENGETSMLPENQTLKTAGVTATVAGIGMMVKGAYDMIRNRGGNAPS